MNKNTIKFLVISFTLLATMGCGKITKNITDKVVDTKVTYVTEYQNTRAAYTFENTIQAPVATIDTLLFLDGEVVTGSVPSVVSGMFGNAYNFTAANQRIDITSNATLADYNNLEISLWINPAPLANTYKTLVAKWSTTGELEYMLQLYSNRLVFSTSNDGVTARTYWSFTDKQILAGKWNQVAVRFDGAAVQFIINGAAAGTLPVTAGIRKGSSPVQIGQRVTAGTPADQYIGYMDAVRISKTFQADVTAVAIADSSIYQNHGANFSLVSGVNTLDASKSLVLNGTTDYVCIGSNDSLSLADSFTLEADIKPTGVAANQYLICKGNGGATTKFNYYLRLNANRPTVGFQDETGTIYEVSAVTALVNNAWAKVAGVWDGEYLKVYINGHEDFKLLVKTGTTPITPAVNGCPVMLGRQDYNALYYKGELDNVSISAGAKSF